LFEAGATKPNVRSIVYRFFKRTKISLNIGSVRHVARAAESESRSPAPPEKRFKEWLKPLPPIKLTRSRHHAPLVKSSARLTTPLRRRLEPARLIRIRTELIVFLSLLRIAQDRRLH